MHEETWMENKHITDLVLGETLTKKLKLDCMVFRSMCTIYMILQMDFMALFTMGIGGGITSICSLLIGQYPHHMTFLPSSFYGENAMESINTTNSQRVAVQLRGPPHYRLPLGMQQTGSER